MDIKLKNQIKLSMKVSGDTSNLFKITAYVDQIQIGYLIATIVNEKLYAFDTHVESNYRRMGIATEIYNFSESITLKKIYPNEYLDFEAISSNDAVEFWRSRGLNLSGGDKIFDC